MDYNKIRKEIISYYKANQEYKKDDNVHLNDEQIEAVTAPIQNSNILLSAGAGCGKTSVLSIRTLFLLETTPLNISNFLIITFTNNSGAEMKERIIKEINREIKLLTSSNKPSYACDELINKLKQEAINANFSSIQTFDSYCNQLVKTYANKLNIQSDFTIIPSNIIRYKQKEFIKKKIEEEFSKEDNNLSKYLFDRTQEKSDSLIYELIDNIESYKKSLANPVKELNLIKENYLKDFPKNLKCAIQALAKMYFEDILDRFANFKTYFDSKNPDYSKLIDKKYNPNENLANRCFNYIYGKIHNFNYDNLNSIKDLKDAFLDITQIKLSKSYSSKSEFKPFNTPLFSNELKSYFSKDKLSDEVNKQYGQILKDFNTHFVNIMLLPSDDSLNQLAKQNDETLKYLIDFDLEISKQIKQFKDKISAYEFQDITEFAINLLTNYPDIRQAEIDKYQVIMVDEYQDFSLRQEELLKLLGSSIQDYENGNYYSRGNIFMVGDMKQSIYRFRQAVPQLFLDKMNMGDKFNTICLSMSTNYRSSQNVLSTSDDIFSSLMKGRPGGGIDYLKQNHALKCGNTSYNKLQLNNIHSYFLSPEKEKNINDDKKLTVNQKSYICAEQIAKSIQALIEETNSLSNTSNKKLTYSSFTILVPSKTKVDIYEKFLNKYQIPYIKQLNTGFNDDVVYLSLQSLILVECCLINKENLEYTDFVHYLASLSRSFIFNMNDDELTLQIQKPFESTVYKTLENITRQFDLVNSTILEIFNVLTRELNVYFKLSSLNNCDSSLASFLSFNSLITNLNTFNFDIKQVADFLINSKDDGDDNIKIYKPSQNAVTITNIHQSKGLEYDIVFLAETTSKIQLSNSLPKLCFSKYGPILPSFANDRYIVLSDKQYQQDLIKIQYLSDDLLDYIDQFNPDDFLKQDKQNNKIIYVLNRLNIEFTNVFRLAYKKEDDIENLAERVRLFYVAITRAKIANIFFYFNNKDNLFNTPIEYSYYQDFISFPNLDAVRQNHYNKEFMEFNIDKVPNDPSDIVSNSNSNSLPSKLVSPIENFHIIDNFLPEKYFKEKRLGKRASKIVFTFDDISKKTQRGSLLHSYLEQIDYSNFPNINLNFIENLKDRKLIENFINELISLLSNSTFNLSNLTFYQEFEYFDIEQEKYGSIDFLCVDSINKKAVIIDYKLKNIDDEHYLDQLSTYKRNVTRIFEIPDKQNIDCYLYSIIDSKLDKLDL